MCISTTAALGDEVEDVGAGATKAGNADRWPATLAFTVPMPARLVAVSSVVETARRPPPRE